MNYDTGFERRCPKCNSWEDAWYLRRWKMCHECRSKNTIVLDKGRGDVPIILDLIAVGVVIGAVSLLFIAGVLL